MKSKLYISILASLILAGAHPVLAADIRIDAVERKSNGLKLQWTNSEPGYAYTLQYRASPSTGTWSNLWSRYRWPGVMTHWTEPTRVLSNAAFYQVVAEPIRAPERGKVLSVELVRQFTVSSARSYISGDGLPATNAVWTTRYYKVVYETVDPFGLPITASGGLFVPQGVPQAMPLLSNQHGTEIYKPWVPSQNDAFYFSEALFFACSGYVTLMPDYLGLGESPGFHPYLHANTEGSAVVDMLRAVKAFCASNSITLNSQLFLTGFSQGGHATVAAHREIELHHTNEFIVTASAPMAGPYDMSGSLYYLLTNASYPYPDAFLIVLAGWFPVYDLADTMEELLASPYDRTLPRLFDGYHKRSEIIANAGTNVQSMLASGFRDDLLNDPDHPFWLAAADNDLLDWAPRAPTRLYHCTGDVDVPYTNAVLAHQSYTNNGACCVELINPETSGPLDHGGCWVPSMVATKAWFDSMKQ